MFVIVGLGNPGKKFKDTRHNTGFLVVERLKSKFPICSPLAKKSSTLSNISNFQFPNKSQTPNFKLNKKLQAEICQVNDILLVKPQTFMNDSGMAVKKIVQYSNITIEQFNNLYIIHDELDLPLGEYKIQFGRGPAGHKGVESVIKELGTQDFWRVRIGIEKSQKSPASPRRSRGRAKVKSQKSGEEFILEEFGKKEREILEKVIEKVTEDLISKIR